MQFQQHHIFSSGRDRSMICAEDCAGECLVVFLIGEWYDSNYTDDPEEVLIPILCMPSAVCQVNIQFLWPISKGVYGFKHCWTISVFLAFAGSQWPADIGFRPSSKLPKLDIRSIRNSIYLPLFLLLLSPHFSSICFESKFERLGSRTTLT